MQADADSLERYRRQTLCPGLGLQGQRSLSQSRVLIVGVGGLGSWSSELLVRAGVGGVRLVDSDRVDLDNLHRQTLYDESDARAGRAKVVAAAGRLSQINATTRVEAMETRLDSSNVEDLARGCDVILDGTDNFPTRFVLNDYAVQSSTPWIFAGVVGCEAQTMTILPGVTPCLRCILDGPPPAEQEVNARTSGVLGPAVSAIAAIQALEAIKVLTHQLDQINPHLLKIDLWRNSIQHVDVSQACEGENCPCCQQRRFDFLSP
jgi:molybdopterin-synthase adenylyltransferase